MSIITDGKGRGNKAAVDEFNRLISLADSRSIIGRESLNENAYVAYAIHNIQQANVDEQLMFFKVNENIEVVISHIVFSGWGSQIKFEMFFDTTLTSGGTTKTPHNLNRSSSKTLNVTHLDNSANDLTVGGNTSTNEFLDSRESNDSFLFDFKDALVLGRDNSFSIQVESGTIGDKVRSTIFYYKRS